MADDPILSVRFFKTAKGNEPVREWLRSQTEGDRKIIGIDIKTVQYGWPMGMPMVEKIEQDLWTLRTKGLSKGISRVFFTVDRNLMILLHGFIKKSQKIPKDDLDLAKRRLTLYYDNGNKG